MKPEEFLPRALVAALKANHVFPEMAACEAALESGWGTSKLARMGNNLFGQKYSKNLTYPTIDIPTKEFENGKWVAIRSCLWPVFPDWETCFIERMKLLRRNPRYAEALNAKNEDEYIEKVSKVWATDPDRAKSVAKMDHKYESLMIRKTQAKFLVPTIDEAIASIPIPELPEELK